MVGKNGIDIDEHQLDKIRNTVPTSSRKQLCSSSGLASYYRRLIPRFASVSIPLAEKTSEKSQICMD